jgi:hypothetical protein
MHLEVYIIDFNFTQVLWNTSKILPTAEILLCEWHIQAKLLACDGAEVPL